MFMHDFSNSGKVSSQSRKVRAVSRLARVEKVRQRKRYQEKHRQFKEEREIKKLPDETLRHFHELALEVEELQERLIRENHPFEIEIYLDGEAVLIDIFRTSPKGTRVKLATKDISDGDFTDWAKIIQEGEGMLFNMEG